MRPGQRIGPYVVRSLLGRGAMGLVLEVEHPELGHRYALKVVSPDMLGDPDAVKRFQREMEAMASVDDHPGIVRVHSAGTTDDGAPYYAMELVRGRSLRDALKHGLPSEQALDLLAQVARALGHLHARGIIHRDVKPENVLVDEDGHARLTDFGLARSLGLREDRLTRTGDLVGTPTHMAPEQALRTLGEVGPWTDVYGLGVSLYETLTGRTPYLGATALEVYTQVAEGAPFDPPSRVNEGVPPALEAVCLRALARRPIDRYPDVASFVADLERARSGDAVAAPARRAPRLLVAVAAGAVALGLGAVGFAVWRADAQERAREAAARDLAGLVAQVERELARGASDDAFERARAGLAALPPVAGGQDRGPREALERLAGEAARRRAQAAWRDGDVRRARDLLRQVPGDAVVDERPYVLALAGDAGDALRAAPAGLDPADRARLAAWAGDEAACADALARVTPPERARALRWQLLTAASLPGLATDDLDAEAAAAGPTSSWGHVARGEAALARGLLPLAAVSFDDALQAAGERGDPDLELQAALGLCQVHLARGDLERAAAQAATALRRAPDVPSPLSRARALGWAAQVALAAAATPADLRAVLQGRDALEAAARGAPGEPIAAAALAARSADDPAGGAWSALGAARRAAAAGDVDAALAALMRAGLRASPAALLTLEREACGAGLDGAPGLLLARGDALAAAAERGNDRAAAREALTLLEAARALRPRSPLAWAATARARRVLREVAPAQEAAATAARLSPACAAARLEQARALALAAEEEALALDLARAAGAPIASRERELALRLDRVALAHAEARAARASDPATDDAARLGAARARVEAAWRAAADEPDPGAWQLAREALGRALDEQLRPLLARVDVQDVVRAREALATAVSATDPRGLDGAVEAAERALARAGWGEPARDVDVGALEALLLRAAGQGGEAHARAFLALAGDLPARALLWARRAERASDDAIARHARLERAAALSPDLPHVVLEQELERRGRTAASLLRLAGVVSRAPELARVVIDALALAPRDDEAIEALLAELTRADAPAADRHRARALLLRGTQVYPPGDLDERALRARAAWNDRASRRAYAEATLALRADGTDAGTRLLRALCASNAGRGAGRGAACDHRALPDVLFDARLARAAAPWASAPLLVELDVGPTELALAAADELLVHGFLTSARDRLAGGARGEAVARRLQPFAHLLPRLDLRRASFTFDVARHLQGAGVAPRLALALRLQPVSEGGDEAEDPLDDASFAALLQAATPGRPDVAAAASATFWFARLEQADGDDEEAETRAAALALEASVRAVHHGHAGGLGLALQPRQVLGAGVRREAPPTDPGDAVVLSKNLPAQPALWELWTGLARPERALVRLARGTAAAEDEDEDEHHERPLEDLLWPWSRSRAHLLDVQGPSQGWVVEWWVGAGDPGDALLALDRAVAFTRPEALETTAYWTIFWQLRWGVIGWDEAPARRRARAAMARAAALRLREVAGSAALRGLAADALLDLAVLDAAGTFDESLQAAAARALAEAEAAPADAVSRSLESRATATWRLVRARAIAGDRDGALAALARLRAHVKDDEDWGLHWVVSAHDPALPWLRRLPEVAEFVDASTKDDDGD